jgi:hypothetical protein
MGQLRAQAVGSANDAAATKPTVASTAYRENAQTDQSPRPPQNDANYWTAICGIERRVPTRPTQAPNGSSRLPVGE